MHYFKIHTSYSTTFGHDIRPCLREHRKHNPRLKMTTHLWWRAVGACRISGFYNFNDECILAHRIASRTVNRRHKGTQKSRERFVNNETERANISCLIGISINHFTCQLIKNCESFILLWFK